MGRDPSLTHKQRTSVGVGALCALCLGQLR